MKIDEMRQQSAESCAAGEEVLNPQAASSFMLDATIWLACAEICERLEGAGRVPAPEEVLATKTIDALKSTPAGQRVLENLRAVHPDPEVKGPPNED